MRRAPTRPNSPRETGVGVVMPRAVKPDQTSKSKVRQAIWRGTISPVLWFSVGFRRRTLEQCGTGRHRPTAARKYLNLPAPSCKLPGEGRAADARVGDRRSGLHRLGRGAPFPRQEDAEVLTARQADLCRPACLARRVPAQPAPTLPEDRHHRPAGVPRPFRPSGPTRSCIWPRKAMSTARSTGRRLHPDQCRGNLRSARGGARLLRGLSAAEREALPLPACARPTRSSASLGAGRALHRDDAATIRARPIRRARRPSDHLVRAWHHTYGLPAMISNCSNNYGPRQFPEKLIPLFILNALEGKPLPVYGTGDECARLALCRGPCRRRWRSIVERGRPGETYNIGGGESAATSTSCAASAASSTRCCRARRAARMRV